MQPGCGGAIGDIADVHLVAAAQPSVLASTLHEQRRMCRDLEDRYGVPDVLADPRLLLIV